MEEQLLLACSLGAGANVGVAAYLHGAGREWLLPAIAGILAGAGWNCAATREYAWGRRGA